MHDILFPEGGWIWLAAPRLHGHAGQSWVFKAAAQASRLLGRTEVPDVFKVLAINSRLFWPWLHFASRLMPYGKLPARERELVILRVAWLCRCRYEWGQHLEIGLRAGLKDAEIVQIAKGPEAFDDVRCRALIRACDELVHQDMISDNNWQVLSGLYTDKLLIEITMLIGHYKMLAGLLNSCGLQLEPSMEAVLEDFNNRVRDLV